jgi:hypothetical protein
LPAFYLRPKDDFGIGHGAAEPAAFFLFAATVEILGNDYLNNKREVLF